MFAARHGFQAGAGKTRFVVEQRYQDRRREISETAAKMTYLELSADNTFYEAFTSALFLPHTDLRQFPSVARVLEGLKIEQPV